MNHPAPGEDGHHITYCRLCEAQCGILAEVKEGVITRILPDRDHPVSQGHLCVKAPGMLKVTYDPDRLLTPLRRTGDPGEFEPVSWGEALDDIAARLDAITGEHGGDSLAAYIGNPAAFSTAHYTYGYGFISQFGSGKFYNATHVDTGARVVASEQVIGDGARYPFPDLPETDFLMIFGGNPMISHMSLITAPRARVQLDDIARRGAVIVVDPRRSETARRYEHQPIQPDSDAWFLVGLLKSLIEADCVDHDVLEHRVTGWESLCCALLPMSFTEIEARCGIGEARIRELALRFAQARTACCYGRVGTNRGRFSSLSNILMDAINIATGNFGVAGGSVIGYSPFEPPETAPRPLSYDGPRSRIGEVPLVNGAQPGGGLADDILEPGPGQLRALFVDCGNPMRSYPDGEKTARALRELELLVCLDFYRNETAQYAHYILPTPTFYERGDVTDLWCANGPEPWLQVVDPVIPIRGEARHEHEIYTEILTRSGRGETLAAMLGISGEGNGKNGAKVTPLEFADALLRGGADGDRFGERPNGLSFERLRTEHPHGYKLADRVDAQASWSRIGHADGKLRVWSSLIEGEIKRLQQEPERTAPSTLKLFGRRFLHTMNSWMHNSDKVQRNAKPTLLMHPVDAQARQIKDGQRVSVRSNTGRVEVEVELSDEVVAGSVSYPHGFGHSGGWSMANDGDGADVNQLASTQPSDWEPVSGNCHLDGIPVEVRPA